MNNFFLKYLLFLFIFLNFFSFNCKIQNNTKGFNHNATSFPLTGRHSTVPCTQCHVSGSLMHLQTNCSSCHIMSTSHTHNLGDCNTCHNTVSFSFATFNHRLLGIPISGKHYTSNCRNCHKTNSYRGLSFECSNCHKPPFIDSLLHTSPNANCSKCHNQIDFSHYTFPEHNSYSTPLTGEHLGLKCSSCHRSTKNWSAIRYRDNPVYGSCSRCHTRDYKKGIGGHHGIAKDANCKRCHGMGGF